MQCARSEFRSQAPPGNALSSRLRLSSPQSAATVVARLPIEFPASAAVRLAPGIGTKKRMRGRASRAVRSQAEPGNEVWLRSKSFAEYALRFEHKLTELHFNHALFRLSPASDFIFNILQSLLKSNQLELLSSQLTVVIFAE